nr:hypothetical protein CFP56_78844 [Quercus suber]
MDTIQYRVDDVQSSKLETRLSSNTDSLSKVVDTTASKLPSSSSSRPLHALSESCSLKESHLKGFRKRFQFPKGTSIRLPRLALDRPDLEDQYHHRVRAALAYACEIEDFDDLIDLRHLYDFCLGPSLQSTFWKKSA